MKDKLMQLNGDMANYLTGYLVKVYGQGHSTIIEIPHTENPMGESCVKLDVKELKRLGRR